MPYSRDVLASLIPQVDAFVKHLLCHRAIRRGDRLPKHIFWSLTSDAHLLQAVVCWCKVFGATGTNDTHWHHLDKAEVGKLQEGFRAELQAVLGLDKNTWAAYQKEVTGFRNNYAAHTKIGFSAPVPKLDLALDIAYLFDHWVRAVIAPDTLEEKPLEELAAELTKELDACIGGACMTARRLRRTMRSSGPRGETSVFYESRSYRGRLTRR